MQRIASCRRWLLIVSVLAVVVGAAWMIYADNERYKRFAVHDPGKMYRSSWLDPQAMGDVVRRHKIRTVVNLCSGSETCPPDGQGNCGPIEDERRAVEAAGGRLVQIVYPGNYTWHADDPAFDETERLFADPEAYPILIHCYHGRERTVKALAIYDIHFRKLTAQESLERMPLWRSEHPWPIVTFAFNYESKERGRATETARQSTGSPRR